MKKLLLLLCALLTMGGGAWAETQTYTITYSTTTGTFYNGSGAAVTSGWIAKWVSNESGKPAVTLTASANNINAANGRMAPGSSTTCTYTLSVEFGYTITGFALNCPTFGAQVTVTPNGGSAVVAGTGENIVVNSNATSFVYSGSNSGRICAASDDSEHPGSSFTITVEGDPEKVAAYNTAKSWVSNIQTLSGLVKDASKYTSNAKSTAEGTYEALLDGDYTTYFHTAYSGTNPGAAHYLQAELTESVDAIYFYYKKRSQNNNNRPTSITISGSNDGENFTDITTINSGLPTDENVLDYISDKIDLGATYKHIRFTVTGTNNGAKFGDYVFFTFSEFYILPSDETIDDAITTYKALPSAVSDLTDERVTHINEVNTALNSSVVNVTYELYESDGTTLVSSTTVEQNKNSAISLPLGITSVTYYDYATEGTIGSTNCTIKVTRTLKSGIVTALSALSNTKCYNIKNNRGTWAVSSGSTALQSTTELNLAFQSTDVKQQFAIINYENNYYLYSVGESKFAYIDGTQLSLTAEVTSAVASSTITFASSTSSNYKNSAPTVVQVGGNSYGVHTSHTPNVYQYSPYLNDDGNASLIQEAGDFDPADAIAALDAYFHPSYAVTYVVQDTNNNALFTSDARPTSLGATITTLPEEFQKSDFYEYNTINLTVSEVSTTATFTATVKSSPLFKFTADATTPVWYKMSIKGGSAYPTYVPDGNPNVTLPTTNADDETVQWAFIGDPYGGFQIINRAANDATLVLGSVRTTGSGSEGGSVYATLATAGTRLNERWFASASTYQTGGFYLFNTEGHALNYRSNANLAYWTRSYDNGSTFTAVEVLEGQGLYEELLAQVEAIDYGSGLGQYTLTGELAQYAGNEAAVISMIKGTYGNAANYTEGADALQQMIAATTINEPAKNAFYRIRSTLADKAYLKAVSGRMTVTTTADKETIFLYDNSGKLIAYNSGFAINNVREIGTVSDAGNTFTFVNAVNGSYVGQYSVSTMYDPTGTGNAETHYLYSTGVNGSNADRNTLSDSFKEQNSFTVESVTSLPVTLNGPVGSSYYATLCLPVDATIEGATAYTLTKDDTVLNMSDGTTTVSAGTPVLLIGTTNSATAKLGSSTASDPQAGTALTGTYAAINFNGNTHYVLGTDGKKAGFFHWDGTVLKGFRAYIAGTSGNAGVKGFYLNNDTPTGVQALEKAEGVDGVVYDLSGRRVSKPTRGLYIVNGKKVSVK